MWPSKLSATQTSTSGKRNKFEDFLIIQTSRAGALRANQRQRNFVLGRSWAETQLSLDASQYQFLHRAALAGSPGLKPAIQRIGNVDGGAHQADSTIFMAVG